MARTEVNIAAKIVFVLLLAPSAAIAADASAPLMALAATQTLNTSGIVTYNIPITLPPGTAGMLPELALRYDTRPADGTMGPGWRLGLDAITLCNRDAKSFCFARRKLVPIKGENGADGTEYRQEFENFTRVFSHGGSGGSPEWFELQLKNGTRLELGRSNDSRGAGRWQLNRAADVLGNYFTLQYGGDASYPVRIDYTANDRAGLKPYNSVRFAYEDGARHRLTHLRSFVGEVPVTDYRLEYDGEGRLIRASRCDAAGACLAPTSFTWTVAGTRPALASVDNGAGDATSFTYAPSPPRSNQPASYPAAMVVRWDRSNGIGGTTGFTLASDGDPVYDAEGYFLGFSVAVDTELVNGRQTTVVRSSADEGYNPLSTTVRFGNVVTSTTVDHYGHSSAYPGVALISLDNRVQTQNDLDGTRMPGTTTSWRYDEFGNALHIEQSWTDGSTKIDNDRYRNDLAHWYLGRLLRTEVARQPAASGLDRASSFEYDRDTGELTQEVIEPDLQPFRLQVDYKYDAFGHRIVKTTSGVDIPQTVEKISYDAKGQFQVSATDATGRTESWRYDSRSGQAVAKTDYWGIKEEWTYDGFGRLVTHSLGGKVHHWRYGYCKGVNGGTEDCPQFGAYLVEESDDGAPDHRVTVYNAFGLMLLVESRANGLSSVIQTRVHGVTGQSSRDCKAPKVGDKLVCADYEWDALGREVHEVQPANSWSWAYHGLTTVRTDNHGNVLTTLLNSQRRQISQTTRSNNGVSAVQDTYDAWGNLLRHQDQQGRVTTREYDVRGNAITVTGPDGRVTHHRFDVLGHEVTGTP